MDVELLKLREFISSHQGISLKKINPTSDLVSDLGIEGDDGYELIHDMEIHFGVDLSEYDFFSYFGREIFGRFDLGRFFKGLFAGQVPPAPVLTIENLQAMIIDKKSRQN